ncbi:MAG: M3 family oligoendopeptidase [Oscillospiraceae bacterium]|nr:M3 family oligoendopeptidase [Oscillospiraceae bacterium]
MTFSQIPYERLTYETLVPQMQDLTERLAGAVSAAEAREVYVAYDKLAQQFDAAIAVVYIRNHLDTTDKFYEDEQAYNDEMIPRAMELLHAFNIKLLATPFRADLEREFGALIFKNVEIEQRAFSSAIVEDLQEENRLDTSYTKLLASAQIEYNGETYNLAQLDAFHLDADREVRRCSTLARAEWFNKQTVELDETFDKLVALRTAMAQKLGHDNYIAMGYDRQERNCYGPAEVAKFRDAVAAHIVPLAAELKAKQAQRIGLDSLKIYDDGVLFPDGNAKPLGTPEEILANGRQMYRELSAETDEWMEAMIAKDAFDVLAKKNKAGGGFCYTIHEYKLPFIYANFNGTSDDVETLTHEAGHSFAAWRSFKYPMTGQREYSYDTAEVHSMAMEFLTWPWMHLFYGAQTDKFKQAHLENALTFLPYGVMVDEFQHIIYEQPKLSPQERNEVWRALESKYRPWLDIDVPFYAEGRRWQAQSHIYSRPFYYIDYCLAQANALSIWAESQTDHKAAWRKYLAFVELAGTQTFIDLTRGAGLSDPFETATLEKVAEIVAKSKLI